MKILDNVNCIYFSNTRNPDAVIRALELMESEPQVTGEEFKLIMDIYETIFPAVESPKGRAAIFTAVGQIFERGALHEILENSFSCKDDRESPTLNDGSER